MLEGQGGDITVAVGTDGIIMVDTQFAPHGLGCHVFAASHSTATLDRNRLTPGLPV